MIVIIMVKKNENINNEEAVIDTSNQNDNQNGQREYADKITSSTEIFVNLIIHADYLMDVGKEM